jgi:hypothetical protein
MVDHPAGAVRAPARSLTALMHLKVLELKGTAPDPSTPPSLDRDIRWQERYPDLLLRKARRRLAEMHDLNLKAAPQARPSD